MADDTLEITVHWGDTILDRVHVFRDRAVRIEDLLAEIDAPPGLVIAQKRGATVVVRVPRGSIAHVRAGGRRVRSSEHEVELGPETSVTFPLANLILELRRVDGRIEMERARRIDWAYPRLLALSTTTHAFFVASAVMTPPASPFGVDLLEAHPSYIRNIRLEPVRRADAPRGHPDAAKHLGPEGALGPVDRPAKTHQAPRTDAERRRRDRAIALGSGLLRDLSALGSGGAIASVLSSDFGPGLTVALGGVRGSRALGDAGGAGGMGTRGTGAGGGGGSLSIGGLRTHGRGVYGDPHGTGMALRGRKRTVRIPERHVTLQGGLDRRAVARVIERSLPRIKYCYEKQLQADPNLGGKISTRFTIAPTGRVAKAQVVESTLGNERVESCVREVLESLAFPRPHGGGIVVVMYPFVFESTE